MDLIKETYIDKETGMYVSVINKEALIDRESKTPQEALIRSYNRFMDAIKKPLKNG